MGREIHKRRLWGNILIVFGAVILAVTGFFVVREESRRRETLARLVTPQLASTSSSEQAAATVSQAASPSATPTNPATRVPTFPLPSATLAVQSSTAAATPLPPTATAAMPAATPTATAVPPTATSTAMLSPTATLPPAPIVRMLAPAIELDAPVVEVGWAVVEQNGQKQSVWEIASYAAGHHKNSLLPGQGGNIVISGHHNTEGEVFKRLVDLKIGDAVTLLTQDGRSITYSVIETMILPESGAKPEQRRANAKYIEPTEDERLTMVTCWPYWTNTHRVIVIAKPKLS
jgi:sortase A